MSAIYPTLPKLAVKDNFDDDDLTDIDDEVFIRDGRNGGLKLNDEGGVKQPLMAPRKKCKKSCTFQTQKFSYRAFLIPLCYGITALIVVLGLIILCIFTANIFPMSLTILKNWLSHDLKKPVNKSEIIPCTSLSSKVLWTKSFPKLTSEAPLRSNDVNLDGIEDIIVGFSTGLDTMDAPEYICTVYFGNQKPCLGGILALNGKTGDTIWTHWTAHAIFSVDCGVDITNDKIKDCVISGRGGILQAVNGYNGSSIWEVPIQDSKTPSKRILDVYDAKFIADMDGDGIGEVIASHAIQSDDIRASNILIISGKTGNIIRDINLPDSEQLFIAPEILVHPDGENIFLLATNSQNKAGGLYIVSQANMFYGDLQLRKLYHDTGKTALLQPVLIDITLDGIDDIVAAMFNSTIIAYNGLTFDPIWNYTVPNSEIISIPIPGYYNDNEIPDLMIKHQIGAGFPIYYYTMTTIIDGRNGQPLLEKPIEDSLSKQMSGLSITVDDFGNDWFLHWSADCLNYEGVKEKYQFLKDQSPLSQTRADLCKLRFNSTLVTKLFALSQHVGPPGLLLYSSENWKSVEFNNSIDPRKEAEEYLITHPQLDILDTYAEMPLVSERSPRVHKNHRKSNIFKHRDSNLFAEFGKYDPDIKYENFDEFKGHKKHNPIENNAEKLDIDQIWTGDNEQSDKEYGGTYEGINNEDEGVDYPQAEIRKQRSIITTENLNDHYSLNFSHEKHIPKEIRDSFISSMSTHHDIQSNNENINELANKEEMKQINDEEVLMNETSMTIVSRGIILNSPEKISLNIKNNYSNFGESSTIRNILDTPIKTNEPIGVKTKNLKTNITKIKHTEASNIMENQITTIHSDETFFTGKTADITQTEQIYKHIFPNLIQDTDDDVNIEKVFKRVSLKDQNKIMNNKKQSMMSRGIILTSSKRISSNIKNNDSSFRESSTIRNILDTLIKRNEPIRIKTKNLKSNITEIGHTEASNIMENQITTNHSDETSFPGQTADTMQTEQIYKLPNMIQDTDDDVNIEKVFERASLKNQNEVINNKKQSMMSRGIILNSPERISSNIKNNDSSFKESSKIRNILDTLIKKNEPIRIKTKNLKSNIMEIGHIEAPDIMENQITTSQSDETSFPGKTADITQTEQIYKFPNMIQESDDDVNIEKVFKQASLKNQNKIINNKKQSMMLLPVISKDHRIRQKRIKKRQTSDENNRWSEIHGIQRQPPTGILLPSIVESKGKVSVDLVFSTFWLPSSEVSLILSQADLECIHKKKALSEKKFEYQTDDYIINECLSERGVNYKLYQESIDRENTKIALGQMTIYRMKLECVCPEDILPNQTCKNISLHQSWPEHLGSSGSGYFKPLRKSNILKN